MKQFNGKVLFLDRSDINTDEIIPARYLTENTKEALRPYLLEDLSLGGFSNSKDLDGVNVIVSRSNFGCGSSREHAPWAFEVNGINLIIAEGFARIFRQNMYNNGMMAVELSPEEIDMLFETFAGKETSVEVNAGSGKFIFSSGEVIEELDFTISGFDLDLVKSGGWVEYADTRY